MENGLDPCVVLSKAPDGAETEGVFLTLDRLIRQWRGKLSACELVVLSACDTQKGIPIGETIMSLPLGFFQAGAPSVVASLWEVDDEATALLMNRFYENLLGRFASSRTVGHRMYAASERMSKADALHEAKVWLRALAPAEVRKLRAELSPEADSTPDGAGGVQSQDVRGARVVPLWEGDYSHPYYWAAFILIGDGGSVN
jgi:CHAT domain-containing protein